MVPRTRSANGVRGVSRFSSRRERRLWMWTLAVLVALFSTLGLARTLADAMGESDVGDGPLHLGLLNGPSGRRHPRPQEAAQRS